MYTYLIFQILIRLQINKWHDKKSFICKQTKIIYDSDVIYFLFLEISD